MGILNRIYNRSLSLLTDLYQVTMAYGYWKAGMAEREAVFHLVFRKNPFQGGYAVAAGLEYLVDYLNDFRFDASDIEYLRSLQGNDGKPMFAEAFLDYLSELKFTCDLDAVPEGTVMFPQLPLVRIKGPLLQCQLLETPMLTIVNFQTLIATKAARVCYAAEGDAVLEFGLRRAQGIDGGLSASRSAYVGGAHATSNVLAGKLFGIPVKGTHAHSWIMAFDTEAEAFATYAEHLPNNCVFLVDTYGTEHGVKNAIAEGLKLRARGFEMVGIRLDSGDLTALSILARKLLDEAGFPDAKIVASNDLDEHRIAELKRNGAKIQVWGVGTRLATAYDQAALGGVYKLAAIKDNDVDWDFRLKLSEQPIKVSNPGIQQVRRFMKDGKLVADLIYNTEGPAPDFSVFPAYFHPETHINPPENAEHFELLEPVFKAGKQVYDCPPTAEIRQRTLDQLATLPDSLRALTPSTAQPVGIEKSLFALKNQLIATARSK